MAAREAKGMDASSRTSKKGILINAWRCSSAFLDGGGLQVNLRISLQVSPRFSRISWRFVQSAFSTANCSIESIHKWGHTIDGFLEDRIRCSSRREDEWMMGESSCEQPSRVRVWRLQRLRSFHEASMQSSVRAGTNRILSSCSEEQNRRSSTKLQYLDRPSCAG